MAAGALTVAYGRTARAGPDACVTVGNTATCQGDQSNGISSEADFLVPPVEVLNVNSLTADISPGVGVDGIRFTSAGNIEINSNTGLYAISVTGVGAHGIEARSTGGGTVTVDHTGDITSANGFGIGAESQGAGAVAVTNDGTIQASSIGIYAQSSTGAVTVDSTGDITSDNGSGIYAGDFGADAGDVKVTSVGGANGILARYDGILARSNTGAVTIDSTGDVTAGRHAIYSRDGSSSTVTLHSGTVHGGATACGFSPSPPVRSPTTPRYRATPSQCAAAPATRPSTTTT